MRGCKGCVLVVEDEALIAMMLEDALRTVGYDVVVAPNGARGFEVAGQATIDALVTDLNMPQLSGQELIALLRAQRPDLPVVVLTGSPPAGGVSALQRPGEAAITLLLKPLNNDDVVRAVDDAIACSEPATS